MSALMEAHRTSSGYSFRLVWKPNPKSNIDDQILDLLNADFAASPTRRDLLRQFFNNRIEAIRANREGRTWAQQLTDMLDYRSWYRGRRQQIARSCVGAGLDVLMVTGQIARVLIFQGDVDGGPPGHQLVAAWR